MPRNKIICELEVNSQGKYLPSLRLLHRDPAEQQQRLAQIQYPTELAKKDLHQPAQADHTVHASGRQSAAPEVHPESSAAVPSAAVAAGTADNAAAAAAEQTVIGVAAAAAADLGLCRTHPAEAVRGPARVLYLLLDLVLAL